MTTSRRAQVTSTIRPDQKQITGPPREVFYIDTRQGDIDPPEEDGDDDDEPILRRPQRSSMPSMIIFAFTGAAIAFSCAMFFSIISTYLNDRTGRMFDLRLSILAGVCWGIPAFAFGGCAGSFVWAVTRRSR